MHGILREGRGATPDSNAMAGAFRARSPQARPRRVKGLLYCSLFVVPAHGFPCRVKREAGESECSIPALPPQR